MRTLKKIILLFVSLTISLVLMTGCGAKADDAPFTLSSGLDENGFWVGVRALDYVEMFDYRGIQIPKAVHNVTDSDIQAEVDNMLSKFPIDEQITNRAVRNGDRVNIDYVGRVDGVEFAGGSTNGMGADVTAGSSEYVDDFLTQIIGHMPGDVFDVIVTFPDDYHSEDLQGKDAVFDTKINYIIGAAELTDEFVKENLYDDFGLTTAAGLRDYLRSYLQRSAVTQYIQEYFINDVTISAVPDVLVWYQEQAMLNSYQEYADMYGVSLEDFLSMYMGLSGEEELLANNADANRNIAKYYLVVQAIAEDAGFTADENAFKQFFIENTGSEDYTMYEEQYGMPFLMHSVLSELILQYVIENATLL